MKLHFDWTAVQAAIDTAKNATEHRLAFGQEKAEPGLWLVGDSGIYIMPNAALPEGEKPTVVYARECNPEKMPFDLWWANKRASFGGDDGCEVLPLADLERMGESSPGEGWTAKALIIEMSPTEFSVSVDWRRPKPETRH